MNAGFREVSVESINENTFKLIGTDWMLITAGNIKAYNTMTASWGALGILWSKPVCFCFVRPVRHTWKFMEKADYFTLSFFGEEYREALNFCGSHSGREEDKAKKTGLDPVEGKHGAAYFKQARLVIEARKIYFQDINPDNFLDTAIADNYPNKDYHRMYVGEITSCLKK